MREIKFRAWDSELKLMSPVEALIPHRGASIYQPVQVSEDGDIDWTTDVVEFPRAVVMQFTGLADKNGVEIYEGDIVSYIENVADGHFLEVRIQVEIEPDGVNFCWWHDDVKVIGNIYENPELLERENAA